MKIKQIVATISCKSRWDNYYSFEQLFYDEKHLENWMDKSTRKIIGVTSRPATIDVSNIIVDDEVLKNIIITEFPLVKSLNCDIKWSTINDDKFCTLSLPMTTYSILLRNNHLSLWQHNSNVRTQLHFSKDNAILALLYINNKEKSK